jgi:hypothetical protein
VCIRLIADHHTARDAGIAARRVRMAKNLV